MAITSYSTFLSYLADLSVTGVTTNRGSSEMGLPDAVQSADLPMKYIDFPFGDESALTFDGGGGWPTLGAEIVLIVQSVELDIDSARFASLTSLIDNLSTALRAGKTSRSKMAWTVNLEYRVFGRDTAEYLCVVAFVQGAG
jgi:hypothetical protein